jgi:hypothetical protein
LRGRLLVALLLLLAAGVLGWLWPEKATVTSVVPMSGSINFKDLDVDLVNVLPPDAPEGTVGHNCKTEFAPRPDIVNGRIVQGVAVLKITLGSSTEPNACITDSKRYDYSRDIKITVEGLPDKRSAKVRIVIIDHWARINYQVLLPAYLLGISSAIAGDSLIPELRRR